MPDYRTPAPQPAPAAQPPDGVLAHPSEQPPPAQPPAPRPRVSTSGDLSDPQFGNAALRQRLVDDGLDAGLDAALCGPIAAAGIARAYGVDANAADLARWGADNGEWSGAGMTNGGGSGLQTMLAHEGVRSTVVGPDDVQAALDALAQGRPVAINFSGHYLLAQGYDPASGKFYVGNTGSNALRGGSAWMTLDELRAHPGTGGELRAFIIPTDSPGAATPQQGLPGAAAATDPNPYGQMARDAAASHGVPPTLLRAQLQWESGGFDPDVIAGRRQSSAGAIGLGQFMPATARAYGIDPTDPRQSADAAARYMADLYRQYGDWDLALIAYNGGDRAVRAYHSGHPFGETQAYLANVHRLAQAEPAAPGGYVPPSSTSAGYQPQFDATRRMGGNQPATAEPDTSQAPDLNPFGLALPDPWAMLRGVGDYLSRGDLTPEQSDALGAERRARQAQQVDVIPPSAFPEQAAGAITSYLRRNSPLSPEYAGEPLDDPYLEAQMQARGEATARRMYHTSTPTPAQIREQVQGERAAYLMALGTFGAADAEAGRLVAPVVGGVERSLAPSLGRAADTAGEAVSRYVMRDAATGVRRLATQAEILAGQAEKAFLNPSELFQLEQGAGKVTLPAAAPVAARPDVAPTVDYARATVVPAGHAIGQAVAPLAGDVRDAASGLPAGVSEVARPFTVAARRFYHGTGRVFRSFNPEHFGQEGRFGPGAYGTTDAAEAGADEAMRGYAWMGTAGGDAEAPMGYTASEFDAALRGLEREAPGVRIAGTPLAEEFVGAQSFMDTPEWHDELVNVVSEQGGIPELRARALVEAHLPAPEYAPNTRAFDLPPDVRLLDADRPVATTAVERVASILPSRQATALRAALGRLEVIGGEALYRALEDVVGDGARASATLARAGYDGVLHMGGGARRPAQHVVIFPESLPKIRNAISGMAGGAPEGPIPAGELPTDFWDQLIAKNPKMAARANEIEAGLERLLARNPDPSPDELRQFAGKTKDVAYSEDIKYTAAEKRAAEASGADLPKKERKQIADYMPNPTPLSTLRGMLARGLEHGYGDWYAAVRPSIVARFGEGAATEGEYLFTAFGQGMSVEAATNATTATMIAARENNWFRDLEGIPAGRVRNKAVQNLVVDTYKQITGEGLQARYPVLFGSVYDLYSQGLRDVEGGAKLGDFGTANTLAGRFPWLAAPNTAADIHMARAVGYRAWGGADTAHGLEPQNRYYRYVNTLTRHLAGEASVPPMQAQASLWGIQKLLSLPTDANAMVAFRRLNPDVPSEVIDRLLAGGWRDAAKGLQVGTVSEEEAFRVAEQLGLTKRPWVLPGGIDPAWDQDAIHTALRYWDAHGYGGIRQPVPPRGGFGFAGHPTAPQESSGLRYLATNPLNQRMAAQASTLTVEGDAATGVVRRLHDLAYPHVLVDAGGDFTVALPVLNAEHAIGTARALADRTGQTVHVVRMPIREEQPNALVFALDRANIARQPHPVRGTVGTGLEDAVPRMREALAPHGVEVHFDGRQVRFVVDARRVESLDAATVAIRDVVQSEGLDPRVMRHGGRVAEVYQPRGTGTPGGDYGLAAGRPVGGRGDYADDLRAALEQGIGRPLPRRGSATAPADAALDALAPPTATPSSAPLGRQGGSVPVNQALLHAAASGVGGAWGGVYGYATAPADAPEDEKLARARQFAIYGAGAGLAFGAGAAGVVAAARHPQAVAAAGRQAARLYELSYASGALSSVGGIVRNTIGSAAMLPLSFAETALAPVNEAWLRGAARLVAGAAPARERYFSDLGPTAGGMLHGAVEGAAAAAHAVADRTPHPAGALDLPHELAGGPFNPLNWPFRAYGALDALFGSVARASTVRVAAYRIARSRGLRGAAADQYAAWRLSLIEQYMQQPLAAGAKPTREQALAGELLEQGQAEYERWAFRDGIQAITRAAGKLRGAVPVLGPLFFSFTTGATAALRRAYEYSPASVITVGARLATGGYRGAGGLARAADDIGRVQIGLGMGALAVALYNRGVVTGAAPTDPQLRAIWDAQGNVEDSIDLGNGRHLPLAAVPQLQLTFGAVAAAMDARRDGADAGGMAEEAGAAMVRMVRDQSFLQSAANLLDLSQALGQGGDTARQKVESLGRRLAAQAVTGLVPLASFQRSIERSPQVDPYRRAPEDVTQRVQATSPLTAQGRPEVGLPPVPPRIEHGEPVPQPAVSPVEAALSPLKVNRDRSTPLDAELYRLGVGYPTIGKTMNGKDLRPDQQATVEQIAGRAYAQRAATLIATPEWQGYDDERRKRLLGQAQSRALDEARRALLAGDTGFTPRKESEPWKLDPQYADVLKGEVPDDLIAQYKANPDLFNEDAARASAKVAAWRRSRGKGEAPTQAEFILWKLASRRGAQSPDYRAWLAERQARAEQDRQLLQSATP